MRAKKGTAAVKLEDNDEVIGIYLCSSDKDKIMNITTNSYYNCYPIDEITATGRVTKGVKAIKMTKETIQTTALLRANTSYEGLGILDNTGITALYSLKENEFCGRTSKGALLPVKAIVAAAIPSTVKAQIVFADKIYTFAF